MSGRAERRRAQRRRASARDGRWQATSTGHTHQAQPVTDPPAKEPGRHRWIATAAYNLTAAQAAAADAGSRVALGPAMMIHFAVGCVDCEQPYETVRTIPCPAGDDWRQDTDPGPAQWVHAEPGAYRDEGGLSVPCSTVETVALDGGGRAVCAHCHTPVAKLDSLGGHP